MVSDAVSELMARAGGSLQAHAARMYRLRVRSIAYCIGRSVRAVEARALEHVKRGAGEG